MDTYIGRVKWFNVDKAYGFVVIDKPPAEYTANLAEGAKLELFFHVNAGCDVDVDFVEDAPSFKRRRGGLAEFPPKQGDLLVCTITEGKKGLQVNQWAHKDWWDTVAGELKSRERFLLVRITENPDAIEEADQYEEVTLWQGVNIVELSARFPKFTMQGGRIFDKLLPRKAGNVTTRYEFWICKDPEREDAWEPTSIDPRIELCCVPRAMQRELTPADVQPPRTHNHPRPS